MWGLFFDFSTTAPSVFEGKGILFMGMDGTHSASKYGYRSLGMEISFPHKASIIDGAYGT